MTDDDRARTLLDQRVEDFLVNAFECLLDGDGLGARDAEVLRRAVRRVVTQALLRQQEIGDRTDG